MSTWQQLLLILGAAALIWWMFIIVKHNPSSFTMSNLNKTLTTMGILALILIGFIAFLVWMLRH